MKKLITVSSGISLIACMIIIAACGTPKNTAASTAAPASDSARTPMVLLKPANGIYEPGNEELTAIQVQYKDATLEQLKQGYTIYTQGACINCHNAKNIYRYDAVHWKVIVDDMAQAAKISAVQKDAVYKYVLAIKAAEPKR